MDRPERKVPGGTMVGVGAREPVETKKASGKKPKADKQAGGQAE